MEQFPENNQEMESLTETQATEEDTNEEEFSTIFAAPQEHNDRKVKKGGMWKKVLAAILAVAILAGGTIAVIKLIPVLDDGSSTSSNTLMAVQLTSDDLESVTINYKNNTLKLSSAVEESTSSSDEDKSAIVWKLEGYDASLIDSVTVSQTATDLASIAALREMDNADADYGFDTPKATAQIEGRGEVADYTITIGDTSPDESGVYIKISGKEAVYLVAESEISCLYEDALYYAINTTLGGIENKEAISSYFTNDAISAFDKITLTGKNYPQSVTIEKLDDGSLVSQYVNYYISSPVRRPADNVSEILSSVGGGIGTVGAYSFDKSAAKLKEFGLDDPYLTVSITVGEQTRIYKFAKVDDTYSAVIADNDPLIRKVTTASLSYIDSKATDFYYKTMFLEGIYDLSSYTVQSGSEKYTFDIKYTPEDEENEVEEKFDISVGGKAIEASNFQDYYRTMLGIVTVDYSTKNISGAYETTITLKHSDGSADTVLGFKKYSDQRYQYYMNGTALGQITSSEYKKIMSYAKTVAAGEKLDIN